MPSGRGVNMSGLPSWEKVGGFDFKWGKKGGKGGRMGDVQFYHSFYYDGVEYMLYDSVYMYSKNAPEPYVGKLVKAWENSDKSKRVKIHWFFRPSEVSYYLRDENIFENELFLASGEGRGLYNINPLEAIAGKCHVVCISKDARNSQPTTECLLLADHVFYRVFDVNCCRILDKMEDNVGGLEVQFVFNTHEFLNSLKRMYLEQSSKPKDNTGMIKRKDTHAGQLLHDNFPGESARYSCGRKSTWKNELFESAPAKRLKNTDEVPGSQRLTTSETCKMPSAIDVSKSDTRVDQNTNANQDALRERVKDDNTSSSSDKVMRVSKGRPSPVDVVDNTTIEKSDDASGRKLSSCMSSSASESEFKLNDPGCERRMKNGYRVGIFSKSNSFPRSSRVRKLEISEIPKSRLLVDEKHHPINVDKGFSSNRRTMAKGPASFSANKGFNYREKEDRTLEVKVFRVTKKPGAEKTNWIKLSWEESVKSSQSDGRLILLQNLDPRYTSGEVEDIIWHAFNEDCTVKVVQRVMTFNPRYGQALAIFKTREAADRILRKLEERCLMLPNQRPLIARAGDLSMYFDSKMMFFGHLFLEKSKRQTQTRDAISTSHYSQSNTIEFEMAMAWCMLQLQFEEGLKALYEQQNVELRKHMADLKVE